MEQRNWHQEAIGVLQHANSQDIHHLIFDIAARDPELFVLAYEARNPKVVPQVPEVSDNWKVVSEELIINGRQVDAIKHCRNMTGLGLKEAKDQCDILRNDMIEAVAQENQGD